MLAMLMMLCAHAADEPAPEVAATPIDDLGYSDVSQPVPANAPGLDFVYTPTAPGQITVDSPYWDLEVMYYKEQHLEGQRLAEKRYAETKDPHLTLHIARFAHQRLEGLEDMPKAEREAIYEQALAVLDEGIAADPNDKHLRFARGVVLARLGTTRGIFASLRYATDVEGAWLETVKGDYTYRSIGTHEQLPCDAYLALGIFYRLVPDLWLVKMISGTRGSLTKSLEMQTKGAECAPTTIRNLKELAVTQMCIGESNKDPAMVEKGKATINRYLSLKPTMESEVIDLKHGAKLLKDPSLACEYSRDGQQDLDEAQLEE